MKKHILLIFSLVLFGSLGAQVRFFFGPSPESKAEETKEQMDKLKSKSEILTFQYTGDTISDSVLIHDVVLMNDDYHSYCILYKMDTSRVAIAVTKLKGNGGFKVTAYWQNRNVKRISIYDKNIKPNGRWVAYYEDRWLKWMGSYKNGGKTGKWKYYDNAGTLKLKEHYQDGNLIEPIKK